jgi:hypothetical protein
LIAPLTLESETTTSWLGGRHPKSLKRSRGAGQYEQGIFFSNTGTTTGDATFDNCMYTTSFNADAVPAQSYTLSQASTLK